MRFERGSAKPDFIIYEEAEGPWHEEEYSYHHVLAHL